MKPKIIFATAVPDERARERIARFADVREIDTDLPETLIPHMAAVEGLIVPYSKTPLITREVIDAGPQLKLVGTTYGGVRQNVDVDYALSKGLTVIHTGASRVRPMAEFTLGLILSALMHIHLYHHDMCRGEAWPRFRYPRGRNLTGRSVGVIGYGRIGRGIADVLRSFTSDISVTSNHLTAEEAERAGVSLRSLNELFSSCEIIVLAGGYTPETHHMISGEQFGRMQEDALFVNIARGKMVDEAAMTEAVLSRPIYVALDVFEEEPLPAESPLRSSDRVLLTPHRGNNAIEFEQRWQNLADEIEAFYTGKQPDSSVTPERARRMSES